MAFYGQLCSLLLVVGFFYYASAQTRDYCDPDLCYGYSGHVGCNSNRKFAKSCKADARLITMTDDLISDIVMKHNEYRNKIAKGFGKFQPAARMASMQWDRELAKLAEFRSLRCNAGHDTCRNTDTFHYVGQNIGSKNFVAGSNINVTSTAITHITTWFNQYKKTTMDQINEYKLPTSKTTIGGFTGMIQEKANRIGCAIFQQTLADGRTQNTMTCNYSFINFEGLPVYTSGPAASQCKTGTNTAFGSLCKLEEEYDVNVIPILNSDSKIIINKPK